MSRCSAATWSNSSGSTATVAARIAQAAREFGAAPLADDMALLVLRAS